MSTAMLTTAIALSAFAAGYSADPDHLAPMPDSMLPAVIGFYLGMGVLIPTAIAMGVALESARGSKWYRWADKAVTYSLNTSIAVMVAGVLWSTIWAIWF